MTKELYELLKQLANMRHPSVAGILKKYGYNYEANIVEDLVQAFDEYNKEPTVHTDFDELVEWGKNQ